MGKEGRKKKEEWKKDEKPMFGRRKYVEKVLICWKSFQPLVFSVHFFEVFLKFLYLGFEVVVFLQIFTFLKFPPETLLNIKGHMFHIVIGNPVKVL